MSYKISFANGDFYKDGRLLICSADIVEGYCPRVDRRFDSASNVFLFSDMSDVCYLSHVVLKDRSVDHRGGPGFRIGRYGDRDQTAMLSNWISGIPHYFDLRESLVVDLWSLESGNHKVNITEWLPYSEELLKSSEAK